MNNNIKNIILNGFLQLIVSYFYTYRVSTMYNMNFKYICILYKMLLLYLDTGELTMNTILMFLLIGYMYVYCNFIWYIRIDL